MSEPQKPEYEIRISGHLDPERTQWFGGLVLTVEHSAGDDAITVLSGSIADRAALFGFLNRIRDLGLALISVNPIAPGTRDVLGDELKKEEL